MDKTFRLVLFLFALFSVSLIGVVVYALQNLRRAQQATQWVEHTHAFMAEVNAALAANRSAEGALHAYLLSESPRQETAFRHAFAQLGEHLEVAKALAEAEGLLTTDLAAFETALIARADRARELLAAHRAGDHESVRETLNREPETAEAEITALAQRITTSQQELLRERDRASFLRDLRATHALYLTAGINLLVLITGGWFIRDNLRTRSREAALLARTNEELEERVKERTAEIAGKNQLLRMENLESRWQTQAVDHQLRYNNLIIASVRTPIAVITRALNISRVNPAMERLSAQTVTELVDRPLAELVELVPGSESSAGLDVIAAALRAGQDLVDHPALLHRPGRPDRKIQLSLFPLRDSDHIVGGVITLYAPPD